MNLLIEVIRSLDYSNHRIRKITVLPKEEIQTYLAHDMKQLLDMQEIANVVVTVEETPFYLHKAILQGRCKKLLALDGSEISSISKEGFAQVLNFIYTDSCFLDNASLDVIFDVLMFSNTFKLKRLSGMCQNVLLRKMRVDSVVSRLNYRSKPL
jgi:hypothetical protein